MHDYHDATFITASVEWKSGSTVMKFELCTQPEQQVRLIVRETTDFECPRKFPWGKSESVNQLTVGVAESGEQRIEVEMQSGDRIIVVGKEILEETH